MGNVRLKCVHSGNMPFLDGKVYDVAVDDLSRWVLTDERGNVRWMTDTFAKGYFIEVVDNND